MVILVITLAPCDILILSPVTPTLATYASVTYNENGLSTTVGVASAQTAAQVQVILYLISGLKLYDMTCSKATTKQ
jgi:hypothetical protein